MKVTLQELRSARILGPLADLVHTGATLEELLHASPGESKKPVAGVSFIGMNKNKGLWHITYRVFGNNKYSDPRGHLVKMRFLPEPSTEDINDLEVEVSCDCGAFVFWGAQYNVKQRNALERNIYWTDRNGVTSLDQSAPTDPKHNYVVCKHINAAAQRAAALIQRHLTKLNQSVESTNTPQPQPVKQTPQVPTPNPTGAPPTPETDEEP